MIRTLSLRDRLAQRLLMKLRPAPLACLLKRILSIKRVPFSTSHGVFHRDPVSQFGLTLSREGEY